MKAFAHRLFWSPRRLWTAIAVAFLVVMVATAVVLAVRINQGLDRMHTAIPASSASAPVPTVVEETPTLTTRDQEFLDTPPVQPFADLGDPTPFVLAAVDSWVATEVEAMAEAFLPAALDQVVGSPPGKGFRLTGEARVIEPGPTKSVVTIPTNVQMLEVVTVAVDGRWMVESIGYLP